MTGERYIFSQTNGGPFFTRNTGPEFLNRTIDERRELNMTCPPEFSILDVSTMINSIIIDEDKMARQDHAVRSGIEAAAVDGLISQDPRTLPDDVREELLKLKRKNEAFKTALCDSFRKTAKCAYGDSCRFAHGVQELRMPPNPRGRNHPKYKTVLCDKFSMTGSCKYGHRCQFIHKIANQSIIASANQTYGFLNKTTSYDRSFMVTRPSKHSVSKTPSPNHEPSSSGSSLSPEVNNFTRDDISRGFARVADRNPTVSRLVRAVENRHQSDFNNTFMF